MDVHRFFPFLFKQGDLLFAPHIAVYPYLCIGVRKASYQLLNEKREAVMNVDFECGAVVCEWVGTSVESVLEAEFRAWAAKQEKSLDPAGEGDDINDLIASEISWARICSLTPEQVKAELHAVGYTDEQLEAGIAQCRAIVDEAVARQASSANR